jgi:hypothetical protein
MQKLEPRPHSSRRALAVRRRPRRVDDLKGSDSVFFHGFLYLPFLGVPSACAPRPAYLLSGLATQRNDLLHPSTRRVPHRRPSYRGSPPPIAAVLSEGFACLPGIHTRPRGEPLTGDPSASDGARGAGSTHPLRRRPNQPAGFRRCPLSGILVSPGSHAGRPYNDGAS